MTIRNHPNVGVRSPISCSLEGCSVSSAGASNPQYRHLFLSWHGDPAAPLYVSVFAFSFRADASTMSRSPFAHVLFNGSLSRLVERSPRASNWQPAGSQLAADGLT